MTEAVYQTDSHLKEFHGIVTAMDGQAVALDRTAFYPGGGGQPRDMGHLAWDGGSAQAVKVRRRGAEVWHTLEGDVPPQGSLGPGVLVHSVLDWERRCS